MQPDRPSPYRDVLTRVFEEAHSRVFKAGREEDRQREDLSQYALRPIPFVRRYLGERTWPASRATLRAVAKHRRVLVCGCRKSSKSHTAAQAILAFTLTAPTRCIVTGPTYTQVRENIFARVRKLHGQAKQPLPGRLGVMSLRMDPTWFAIGLSTNKPGYLQGFHADIELPAAYEYDDEPIDEDSLLPADEALAEEDLRRSERDPSDVIGEAIFDHRRRGDSARLVFVLDEMAEMRADIVETLSGSWMGDNVYVLAQFNPTFPPDSGHPAARFLRPNSGWHRIHIAGREPPADQHDADLFDICYHQVPPEMMPDAWVEERIADWGPGSALTACHVYGLPAAVDRERQFIPYRLLKAQFDATPKDDGKASSRHIGWDVAASEAGDFNVAQLWVNGLLTAEEQWRSADTAASTAKVLTLAQEWGVGGQQVPYRNVHIDATGGSLGKSIADALRARGIIVDAVDFGAEALHEWDALLGSEMHFVNRKAELLWVLRCALAKRLAAIPRTFSDTIRQAQWYTFKEVPRAAGTALQAAESKEKIRELFGRSPDNLEAALLAWSRGARIFEPRSFSDWRSLSRAIG